MKHIAITAFALATLTPSYLRAEESSQDITGLEKSAEAFVIAYNAKDAAALSKLFTPEGEIIDRRAEDVISGTDEIKAHYENVFSDGNFASVAIEVDSVRIVGPGIAVEDGMAHFTVDEDTDAPRSVAYSAVLAKNGEGDWKIASSRTLEDVTGAEGNLDDLANLLKGEWTAQNNGFRLDFAFGWDSTGKYLAGELLAEITDAEPVETKMRFGWDAAKKTITCWSFDNGGGFSKADWIPVEGGYLVRTEGTTGDGEAMSANQSLIVDEDNSLLWSARDRMIGGEKLDDNNFRIVRRAPSPSEK